MIYLLKIFLYHLFGLVATVDNEIFTSVDKESLREQKKQAIIYKATDSIDLSTLRLRS